MLTYVIPPGKKGIEALGVKEIHSRPLKSGEVCVRMHAVSLNYRDLLVVKRGVSRELVPLSDGAGVVAEVGPAVSRLKNGQRHLRGQRPDAGGLSQGVANRPAPPGRAFR